jgi:LemA protein
VAAIRQVFAVAENYPQLRASDNFLALQQELAITEDRIQAARRFYNANVQAYNRRVGSVPSNLVAAVCGFTPAEFFELDPATQAQVSQPVKVDFTNPQQPAA